MSGRCTRCFRPRDREPATFVELFSDSAWCEACLSEYYAGERHLHEAIVDTRETEQQARSPLEQRLVS